MSKTVSSVGCNREVNVPSVESNAREQWLSRLGAQTDKITGLSMVDTFQVLEGIGILQKGVLTLLIVVPKMLLDMVTDTRASVTTVATRGEQVKGNDRECCIPHAAHCLSKKIDLYFRFIVNFRTCID